MWFFSDHRINCCSFSATNSLESGGQTGNLDDPAYEGGHYYDAAPGEGPHLGLANARRIAMIHYRSDEEFDRRFDRIQQ